MARQLNKRLALHLMIFAVIPFVLLVYVLFFSDWLSGGDPQIFFEEAKSHVEKEDWSSAWLSIRRAMQVGGAKDAEIQHTLGEIAMHQKPPVVGAAIQAWRNALKLKPDYFEAQRDLAQLYFGIRYWKEALAEIERLAELDPSFGKAYVWGAAVEMTMAEAEPIVSDRIPHFENAVKHCLTGIERVPSELQLYRLLAVSYSRLDQPEKMDEAVDLAVANNPTDPEAYVLKASRLIDMKRLDEAVDVLKEGLEKAGEAVSLYKALGETAARDGDFELAKEYFYKMLEKDPKAEDAHLRLSAIFRTQNERDKALEVVSEGLAQYPGSVPLLAEKADIYIEMKDQKNADSVIEQIQSSDPDSAILNYLLGKREMANRRVRQAITYLEQAKEKGNLPQARVLLGRAYLMADELGAAQRELGSLLVDRPDLDLTSARRTLAQVQLRLLNFADAERDARAVIEGEPGDVITHMVLAQALVGQGRYDAAVEELEDTIKQMPEEADPILLLADIYRAASRNEKADEAFRRAIAAGAELERVYARYMMFLRQTGQQEKLDQVAEEARKALPDSPILIPGTTEALEVQLRQRLEQDPSRIGDVLALALLYQGSGQTEKAKETFQLALDKADTESSEWRQAWQQLYVIDLATEAYDGAAELVSRLREVDPESPQLLLADPLIAMSKGEYEEAEKQIRSVLETHQLSQGHYLLGHVLSRQQKYDEAVSQLERSLELRPNLVPARLMLGRIHLAQGNYSGALYHAGEALKFSPGLVPALEVKAVGQAGEGNWEEAVQTREQIATIVPENVGNLASLAALYLQQHAPSKAEEAFEKAYKIAPDNAFLVRRFADFYAETSRAAKGAALVEEYVGRHDDQPRAYVLQGEFTAKTAGVAEAETYFRKAAQMEPDDPWPLILLGDQWSEVPDWEKAEKAYVEAAQRETEGAVARKRLADVHMLRDDTDKAQEVIDKVLADDPGDTQALVVAGRIASKRGDLDQARELIEQAIQMSPRYGEAKYRLAELFVSRNPMRSLTLLDDIDPADPAYEKGMLLRANINQRRGQLTESVLDLRRLIAFRPTSLQGRMSLASRYMAMKEADRATPIFEQLVRERPDDATLWVFLGDSLFLEKRYAEALQRYEKARSLKPELVSGLTGEAVCLVALNRKDEAVKRVQHIMNMFPTEVWPRLALVQVYEMTGDPDRAVETIRTGLLRHPDWQAGYTRVSDILRRQKKVDEARELLEQGIAKMPDSVPIRTALSNIEMLAQRWEAAKAVLDPVAKEFKEQFSLRPEDRAKLGLYISPMSNYSLALYKLGRTDEAIEYGLMIWNLSPTEVTNANNTAWIIATEKGDLNKAEEILEVVMRLVPDHPQILDTRGWVAHLKGDLQGATGYLERSVRKQDNPEARYHLARTYEARERTDEARENYQRALELGLSDDMKEDAEQRLAKLQPAAEG